MVCNNEKKYFNKGEVLKGRLVLIKIKAPV